MRFFKYGEKGSEVFAIVLPGSLQRSLQVREGDEYEFIELAPGAFFLASKQFLHQTARHELLAKLGQKAFGAETDRKQLQQTQAEAPAGKQAPTAGPKTIEQPITRYEVELERTGYLVIDDEDAAKAVGKALEVQIKQGLVLGVRGFDKRFYIVTREFYEANSDKIMKGAQKKECTADEVAGLLKTSEAGANAVLQVMKEEGDVLEKRRGVFQFIR